MRREIFLKQRRESFGNIYEAGSYKGPWAEYMDKNEEHSNVTRIISKQNINPGNEVCKMEKSSLRRYFSPSLSGAYFPPKTHKVIKRHSEKITFLHFMKRYDFLISAGMDGKVILGNNKPLRMFIGHSEGISGVGFSFDEMVMITGSHDGWIKKWDVETGRCTERWNLEMKITTCSVNDNAVFVGGMGGEVALIDSRCSAAVYSQNTLQSSVISTCISDSSVGLVRENGSIEFRELNSGILVKNINGRYRSILNTHIPDTFIARTIYEIHRISDGEISRKWEYKDRISCIGTIPGDNDVIYSTVNSELLHLYRNEKIKILSNKVTQLCVSARENRRVGVGFASGEIEIWE